MRYSEQERLDTIAQYEKSGLSQRRFCEENNIKISTFSYWLRRKKENGLSVGGFGGFISVSTSTHSPGGLEIIYPNGVRLKTSNPELSIIRQLIRLY